MIHYKTLIVWQKAMLLVRDCYSLTCTFPREEIFALTSQIKRAATSVPANIAEGCGRNTRKDTKQFLYIARGSLYELDTLLSIAISVKIISEDRLTIITPLIEECLKLLNGLINRHESSPPSK